MNWYDDEVRMLESDRHRDPEAIGSVVFYGSSSIRLWDNLALDLRNPRIRNLGFGGSTLEECAQLFRRLVVPYRPRSLVVYVGDNDLGHGRSTDEVFTSFCDLIRQVDAELGPIPFGYFSIKPSPALWSMIASIRSINQRIQLRLSERPNSTYIDVHSRMLDANGLPNRSLYAPDGLHLSPSGYQVWTRTILTDHPQLIS